MLEYLLLVRFRQIRFISCRGEVEKFSANPVDRTVIFVDGSTKTPHKIGRAFRRKLCRYPVLFVFSSVESAAPETIQAHNHISRTWKWRMPPITTTGLSLYYLPDRDEEKIMRTLRTLLYSFVWLHIDHPTSFQRYSQYMTAWYWTNWPHPVLCLQRQSGNSPGRTSRTGCR